MQQKKTLLQREKELRALLGTQKGRKELESLAKLYESQGGRVRPEGSSLVTYVIVHEREKGLIAE